MFKKYFKKLIIFLSAFILLIALLVYYCNYRIENSSENKIYSEVNDIPFNRVGLLLGTGKFLSNKKLNPYYVYRIDGASQLIKAGKIKYLIISGDNSRLDYDEPNMMRADLIKAGIDSTIIFLDFAGFRTFDSIVRSREIFSQDSLTIISQPFHNQRAIYIANRENIVAIGFNAKDVSNSAGARVQIREKFARVKVFLDYLFGKSPKFLGPKVEIPG